MKDKKKQNKERPTKAEHFDSSTKGSKYEDNIVTIKKEYDEIKDSLQRLQAEFSNFRKRTEEEKSKFVSLATEQLIRKILPVMDNFELALEAHNESTEFSKGIEMIYAQLKQALAEEGLKPIVGQGKFDPKIHEAVLVEETEDSENEIKQVLQSGYKLGDKVIRHAKVKISKKKQH